MVVLLILGLVLPPCSNTTLVYVHADVPEVWRQATKEAVATWNLKLYRDVFVYAGELDPVLALAEPHGYVLIKMLDKYDNTLATWHITEAGACGEGGEIRVRRKRAHCKARRHRVIVHELGHALGLPDVDGDESIMVSLTPVCGKPMRDDFTDVLEVLR